MRRERANIIRLTRFPIFLYTILAIVSIPKKMYEKFFKIPLAIK